MTAPEDQNGLRETLARAVAERDAAIEMKAREVVSVGLPDNAKWLLASKDLWHARALAAEAEITRLKETGRSIRAAEGTLLRIGPRVTISCETDAQARAIYDELEQLLDATSS